MIRNLEGNSRSWRNFALQLTTLGATLVVIAWWKQTLTGKAAAAALVILALTAAAAMAQPSWFRHPYRASMQLSAFLGDHMGRLVLTLLFGFAFIPLGWLLRVCGYDPLNLERRRDRSTYWTRPGRTGNLDQMF